MFERVGLAGEGLGAEQGGVGAWCSRCCWRAWLVAVLETVAQVEATGLAETTPRQGVTMVGAVFLEGAAGQGVTMKVQRWKQQRWWY